MSARLLAAHNEIAREKVSICFRGISSGGKCKIWRGRAGRLTDDGETFRWSVVFVRLEELLGRFFRDDRAQDVKFRRLRKLGGELKSQPELFDIKASAATKIPPHSCLVSRASA
jgi:hypothetical protein